MNVVEPRVSVDLLDLNRARNKSKNATNPIQVLNFLGGLAVGKDIKIATPNLFMAVEFPLRLVYEILCWCLGNKRPTVNANALQLWKHVMSKLLNNTTNKNRHARRCGMFTNFLRVFVVLISLPINAYF